MRMTLPGNNLRSEGWIYRSLVPVLLFVFFLTGFPTTAHDSLYNYLEVRISDEGRIELEFSVHAADFGTEFGIDPNSQETDWYADLPDTDQQTVRNGANAFLQSSFRLLCGKPASSASPVSIPLIGEDAVIDRAARPGSFLASATLPSAIHSLKIDYEGREKRLMIVVTRPGAFPKVHDIAPHSTWQMPISPQVTAHSP